MRKIRLNSSVALAILLGATGAAQASRTYEVKVEGSKAQNESVGGDFLVSGSITTDGTVGYLTPANILDWSLSVTFNAQSTSSMWAGHAGDHFSCSSLSCGLNTDATGGLYFDFADSHGHGTGSNAYFAASSNSPSIWFTGSPSFGALMVRGGFPSAAYIYGYGNTLIGQAAAVPEPTSAAMLAVALLCLAPAARKAVQRKS